MPAPTQDVSQRIAGPRMPAKELVETVLRRWRQGEPADVQAVLEQHPELRGDKRAFLELAYEQFQQQLQAGFFPDASEFCRQMPVYRTSLRYILDADSFLDEHLLHAPEGDPNALGALGPGDAFLGFTLLRELGQG